MAENDFIALVNSINQTHKTLKRHAASAVNVSLTVRNWLVGFYIVEFEQNGDDKAKYGAKTLKILAENLSSKDGFSYRNLRLYRQFFSEYYILFEVVREYILNLGSIGQPVVAQLPKEAKKIWQPLVAKLPKEANSSNSKVDVLDKYEESIFVRRDDLSLPPDKLLYKLSYSHFVQLLGISKPLKRAFYELECIKGTWSKRELQRQIHTLYFERSGISKNKEKLAEIINEKTVELEPQDIINSPFTFEFLGLNPKDLVSENDLEQAIIDNLQSFLLEIGHGFCFESRQKRILIGDEYFFIDLVFYHRVLKCHVIIELKTNKFQQHYISQLDTYLNYFNSEIKLKDDNPPIGILLCTHKNDALVKYATASLDKKIFVQKYLLELPDTQEFEDYMSKALMNYNFSNKNN